MSVAEAVLRWWLAYSLITVALAPVVWWMAAGLGPYRHALLRPVGLALATFVVWWPAALLGVPFNTTTVSVAALVVGVVAWAAHVRQHGDGSPALVEWRAIVLFEGLWLFGILGYVVFRVANPDIAFTEKPMEIALLNSVVISSDVPAPDPWFAGSPINYYYFGYQSVATLVHLSRVETAVAFNLMLASIFASTLTCAAGLGAWLAERARLTSTAVWVAGALAAFFVGVAGNLETFVRLVRDPSATVSAGWWDGVGWQASRVISDTGINGNPDAVDTINEFPAFSFVLGDLHPHLTTLPMLLSVVVLATGLAAGRAWCSYQRVAAVGASAGLLYASNSWDAPVGVVVVLGALALAIKSLNQELLLRAGAALAGAAVAALPFAIHYTAPVGVATNDVPAWFARIPVLGTLPDTIAIVTWRPSSATELLTVHGLWIVSACVFSAWVFRTSETLASRTAGLIPYVVPAGLVVLALAIAWAPALVLLGIPGAFLLAVSVWDTRQPARIVAGLFAAGFALALVPEFLYIQDSFGSRMNTVFKLNFQAWILLGVASAASLAIVAASNRAIFRRAGSVAIVVAVLVSMPYAVLSAEDWMDMGVVSGTLDGSAYLAQSNPGEAAAVAWLASEAGAGDVIVEAPGCAYQSLGGVPMNRFSAFTGVPTMLGWANHERQWRRGEFTDLTLAIGGRDQLAQSWLNGAPGPTPNGIEPRFIVMGVIERSTSADCEQLVARGPQQVAALEELGWQIAFQEGQTTILARAGDPVLAAAIEVY